MALFRFFISLPPLNKKLYVLLTTVTADNAGYADSGKSYWKIISYRKIISYWKIIYEQILSAPTKRRFKDPAALQHQRFQDFQTLEPVMETALHGHLRDVLQLLQHSIIDRKGIQGPDGGFRDMGHGLEGRG